MKEKIFDMSRQKMEDNGKMSESQIDQAMEMARKFFIPFAIAGTLIGTLICGAIASLIGAAVAKKKPVNPLDQMNA
jgi:putative Ca2+/H+ antiporter (TMEM165/GDT1 family)